VVSVKSGHVFERRLIEKFIDANGKDPVTNESMSREDIIPVKSSKTVKPRPVAATSIPSMLQLFQNEWDAMMLETYTLKQHLETVRQELAHALYQHDAACRVIARLIKERDGARNALASLQAQLPEAVRESVPSRREGREPGVEAMEVDGGAIGLSDQIRDKLQQRSQLLSKERKKRQISPTLAKEEDIKEYKNVSAVSIHKASAPGVLCVDIHPTKQELVVTGGVDHTAIVFNRETEKMVATLSGHSKRVNDVVFHPTEDVLFTCSQDKTARVWRAAEGAYHAAHVVKIHTDEVVGLTLHATGDYIATASQDKTWAFHDIHSGACLVRVADPNVKAGFQCVCFHPDGLILGTGTIDSLVRIWDIKSQANVATFEGHVGKVFDIAFSENGYYLATAAEDSVKLWDLRKLKNFHTIPLESGAVSAVSFDYSGNYLAIAGNDLRIYAGKNFTPVKTFADHTALVTDAKFGRDATFIASTSMDRHMRIYSRG
jgi:pre-mRNA-processing factor 19